MRPIDADALKEYIDAQKGRPFIGCTIGEALKMFVDEQPTTQPEPQWIPVSERLPEEPGYYITSNEYGGVIEDFYCDDYFWIANRNAYSVIAWMPKPKAYKPNK